MLEIKITAKELAEAINNLAKAIGLAVTTPNGTMNGATASGTICAAAEQPKQTVAVNTPAVTVTDAKEQPLQYPAIAVPTTNVATAAPQYTLEMLAKAGTALIDAGKMADLQALLQKYGVEALTALDPAQYGAVATELRAMGATI